MDIYVQIITNICTVPYIYIYLILYTYLCFIFFLGGGRVPLPYHCNVKHSATRSCCLQIALRFFLPPKAEIVTLSGNATLAVGEMVRYVPALNIPSCHIWVFPKIGIPQNGWFIIYNGKPY